MGGLVAIGGTTATVLVVYLRRLTTRQWQNIDPLDSTYGATFKRTFYAAARVKWQTYVLVAFYGIGAGLLLASAIAKIVLG